MNRIRFYCNHSTETRSYTLSYENAHPEYKYLLANDSFGSRYRTLSEAVNVLCHRYYSVQNSIKVSNHKQADSGMKSSLTESMQGSNTFRLKWIRPYRIRALSILKM